MCPSGASEPTVSYICGPALTFDECFHSISTDRGKYCIGKHSYRSRNVWLKNLTAVQLRCELQMTPQEYQFMQHKGQLIIGMRPLCIV